MWTNLSDPARRRKLRRSHSAGKRPAWSGLGRRLLVESLESRNLLSGIASISPTSASAGTSGLSITINLDTAATPPVPPATAAVQSATIGTIQGGSLKHTSQYVVTGTFSIPSTEAAGSKDVGVSFSTPNGTVSYSLAGGFTVIAPEIALLDGATDIPDDSGSDAFGSTVVGTPVTKTFTVKNTGSANLTLSTPITVPAGFTVTSTFGSTTLAAGATTSFAVRLDATAAGDYSGTLSFGNNDGNENPFNFAISGTVTATVQPEIEVWDGTTQIADGTGSASLGGTALGTPVSKTFTVKNAGTSNLTLSTPISVPTGFSLASSFGSTTLTPGGTTTFVVQLNASGVGSTSGTLSFANSDADENPFDFTLSGTVVAPPSLPYTIVDTGQVKCYNATTEIAAPAAGQAFYGQDAQCMGNQPSFMKSGDGLTVYDVNTGLTWQHTPDTNVDGSITASDKFTWTTAQARPAALNAAHYGGYSDWRLPTIKELYSLIDFRGTDPSSMTGDTSSLTPFIDRNYFDFAYGDTSAGERVIDSQYASSTLYVGNGRLLFGVNFADGRIKGYGLTAQDGTDKTFLVQCVRGNTSYGVNSFVNNGDGTITDAATGLMWMQADSGSGMNWTDALAWVQTKNAANYLGHNDWRLPNAKELESILDYTRSPDSTSSAAINAMFSATQITNENYQADYPWYWSGTTHTNDQGSAETAAYVCFGRALGYMNSTWVDIHGAGCQRSDPKSGSLSDYTQAGNGYYRPNAPQGDAIRIFDYVRLVRDAGTVVQNIPPAAAAGGPYSGVVGDTIALSGSASTDSDGTIAAYKWDLDNDGQYDDATGVTASFSATAAGTFTVGLQVTDDDEATGTATAAVTVTATPVGQPYDGYNLYAPLNSTATYLVDNSGNVVHSWASGYQPGQSVYLLENGLLLHTGKVDNATFNVGGAGGIVQLLDFDGNVTWSYEYSSTTHLQHHDVKMLPDGNVLLIAWQYKTQAEAVAAGRNPSLITEGSLWPDSIVEVHPTGAATGEIVWQWNVWDHLVQDYDSSKANYGVVAAHPELVDLNFVANGQADWNHFNSVDYNADLDQILVSVHQFGEIWVIDHSTTTAQAAGHTGGGSGRGGDLLYRWGNPRTYDAGTTADQKFFGQHDAEWIDAGLPGAGHILVFNNGQGRTGGNYSSVDEIAPPVNADDSYTLASGSAYGPSATAWRYTAATPSDFYAQNISSAQRLPNGDTLICDGPNSYFFEVNSAGQKVWDYDTTGIVFRVARYSPNYAGFNNTSLEPMSMDVDDNGSVAPMSDGLVILRYLFDFRGQPLVRGALDANAVRTNPTTITAFLDRCGAAMLDVDGNTAIEPMSDGLLLLRYLFDFRGSSLIAGVVGSEATRTTSAQVVAFLDGFNLLSAKGESKGPYADAALTASADWALQSQLPGDTLRRHSRRLGRITP